MYDLNTILIYGITFGILFMTIIYTFVRYISLKEGVYLAYSIMQAFSLGFIVVYSKLFDFPQIYQEFFLVGASLAAVVFAIGFYEGKFIPSMTSKKELFINTLLLNIVILTAFYHYMVFEYLPYTIIYAILFISIIFNIKENSKAILIYVFGWSIFCFLLFISDFKSLYEQSGHFDIVALAFVIEAVLFTLSVAYKYSSLRKQSQSYENMLLQQSRLAKSGEMIANITHQFRQPLNNISYIFINLKKRYENKKLDDKYFYKKVGQVEEQVQYLSKTIEDFKSFYSPTKTKSEFLVKDAIDNALQIQSAELKRSNIECRVSFKSYEDISVYGIQNELSQVILSIVSNACDILVNIEEPKINIEVNSTDAEVLIKISDNGGGIKKEDINKIFQSYYSTKEEGTGLGLYLSKLIIEQSFKGKLEVSNNKEGACFTLFIEKSFD
jgi:signal transduction histidine kinase